MRDVRALGLSALLLVAYAAAYALLHPLIAAGATALAVVPSIFAGALLGLRWGVGITLLTLLTTLGLWNVFDDSSGSVILRVGGGFGAVMMVAIAAGVGHLRDLNRQTIRGLNERENIVAALRGSEERLQAVATQLPVVILAFDLRGKIWRSEGSGLAKLALATGAVDGRSIFDLSGDATDQAAVRLALAGSPSRGNALLGNAACLFHYVPTKDAAGTITGAVGVALIE
jgi:PAS domain-containing protein